MAHRHVEIAMLILIVLCLTFYLSTAQNNDPRYIGCYEDSHYFRHSGWMVYPSSPVTVDVCAAECAGQGSVLSGLINGNSCWCSNNTVFNRAKCSGRGCCDRPCAGNAYQTCGGTHSLDIYEAVVDRRYLGCFLDPKEDRIFSGQVYGYASTNKCIKYCGQLGHPLAGTQFSIDCWCGSGNYSRHGRCISERNCICNMPCQSNQYEKCGAGHTMSVYKAECREPGKWGSNCQQTCHCFNGTGCHFKDGRCPNDMCAPGWKGHSCNQECREPGKWGSNCQQTCHCFNGTGCHFKDGRCPNDMCAPGWKGHSCNQGCQRGSYGVNCQSRCDGCYGKQCNQFNGHCTRGCIAGLKNPYCNEQCNDGTFGINCAKDCHCQNGEHCDKSDGMCPSGVCGPGYDGHADPSCQKKCGNGKFGLQCKYQCRCNKGEDCDKTTGACADNECSPGYTAPQNDPACQSECENEAFGVNCTKQCHCLNSAVCAKDTGYCSDRKCADGYKFSDKSCQTECQAGTFGMNCSQKCGCSNTEECDKASGKCHGDSRGLHTIGIIVSVITILLLIAIIGFGVYHRRKLCKLLTETSKFSKSTPNNANNIAIYENTNRSIPASLIENTNRSIPASLIENTNRSIPASLILLERLESLVLAQKRLGEPFKEEYESLSKGNIEDQTGNLPGNKPKNRFKNIIPYDSSRVKLTVINNIPLSDYINASFIDGYDKKQQFIASQAPTQKTLEDFWRMLWEQDVKVIVMLTELVEGAKMKCHRYWADNEQTLRTGDMAIKTLSEEVYQDYVVRKLEITKGGQVKHMTQMHYIAWKDYNVPDNGNTMLHFHLKVKEKIGNSRGDVPVVVHCSAGVGRTGTFIALDHLLQQAKKEGAIDVFSCVEKMRAARTNMVNSRVQYEYLHDTMLEWYKVGLTAVETSDFRALYNNASKIRQQYQLLESIRWNSTTDFEDLSGNQEQNKKKNRKTKIIPVSRSQVKLMTNATTDGDYINAVFVDGYQKKNAFIATQLPLPDTRGDFWRMVWDYKLNIFISLIDDPKDFWPKPGQQTDEGLFHIETKSSKNMDDKIATYDIKLTYEERSQNVRIIKLSGFNKSEDSIRRMLEIHNTVQKWQQSLQCNTLLVQCLFGVQLCGIFIAMSNLLKMITTEREVDVFQVVKRMRAHRPEFIQNLEEYQLLYQIIHQYLHSDSNLYMNLI